MPVTSYLSQRLCRSGYLLDVDYVELWMHYIEVDRTVLVGVHAEVIEGVDASDEITTRS